MQAALQLSRAPFVAPRANVNRSDRHQVSDGGGHARITCSPACAEPSPPLTLAPLVVAGTVA